MPNFRGLIGKALERANAKIDKYEKFKKWELEADAHGRDIKIDRFMDKNPHLTMSGLNIGGIPTELICDNKAYPIDLSIIKDIEKILPVLNNLDQSKVRGFCQQVAKILSISGICDGTVSAFNSLNSLLPYDKHSINYLRLTNGNMLGVDFTAQENFDAQRGFYKIIMFQFTSEEDLQKFLSDFYGGVWEYDKLGHIVL
jgi:hypothetical protein